VSVDPKISDGDLVLLARSDDPVAFRLLVERYRPMALARALSLCGDPDEAEDIVQDAFLQAFTALDRLRDPQRFAAWLGGIVRNSARASRRRRAPLLLLEEWPEEIHPVSADGLPEPALDDTDRGEVLRQALENLPARQREAVRMFYYADMPVAGIAGQLNENPGAVKARLHKARGRLHDHIAAHRPDLVPYSPRRIFMTTVRIAHAQPQPDKTRIHHVLVVLADDAGRRALPIWLMGIDSLRLLLDQPPEGTAMELTGRLLQAAGVSVTGVDIDELGPDVPAARIELNSPAGTRHVTGRLADGLALALLQHAPIRVADALMDQLGEPVSDGDLITPFLDRRPAPVSAASRRRRGPRNLAFADGLDGWDLRGSFLRSATSGHWEDYSGKAIHDGYAVLGAAVPEPYGFADLRQGIVADKYRGRTVRFSGELRAHGAPEQAGLYLRTVTDETARGSIDNRVVADVEAGHDWTRHEVTAQVPADAVYVLFGITLTGPGRIELRNAELVSASTTRSPTRLPPKT
jgi:RNA polymerase sigma-70 factor, ECF subfamily